MKHHVAKILCVFVYMCIVAYICIYECLYLRSSRMCNCHAYSGSRP